ncbi:hypothetical protein CROQUDRAFT_658423 [Cronartium quercuum f. sp. fusiforme G11]|uniref:Uncharacterized protein n=1 Tax=Cronartium quercuum f. sp. fusiforme G11 TaxID=708437 RepID=A0A9P6TBG5_9BASI|nr:hypothetical protein CROQUDRAFT_658423 [Cronartium quercuum f. sp. fusiforme G11]
MKNKLRPIKIEVNQGSGWLEERVKRTKQEVELKEKRTSLKLILKEENKNSDNKNDMMNPVSSRGNGLIMIFRVPVN